MNFGHNTTREQVNEATVVNLKAYLKSKGLKTNGNKEQLVERIYAYLQRQRQQEPVSESGSEPESSSESDNAEEIDSVAEIESPDEDEERAPAPRRRRERNVETEQSDDERRAPAPRRRRQRAVDIVQSDEDERRAPRRRQKRYVVEISSEDEERHSSRRRRSTRGSPEKKKHRVEENNQHEVLARIDRLQAQFDDLADERRISDRESISKQRWPDRVIKGARNQHEYDAFKECARGLLSIPESEFSPFAARVIARVVKSMEDRASVVIAGATEGWELAEAFQVSSDDFYADPDRVRKLDQARKASWKKVWKWK